MSVALQQNMTPIFGHAAPLYQQRGWYGTLLLPVRRKKDPKPGHTGYDGVDPDIPTIHRWMAESPYGNICLRVPENVIGIDVDSYDGRNGGRTIAALEAQLGPLPPTWITTSREDGSGIRLYRVPLGIQFVSDLGKESGVEIIRRAHRYAIVWPSIHEDTGNVYRWYAPGWVTAVAIPSPNDLTELPSAWVQYLTSKQFPNGRPLAIDGQGLNGDPFFTERVFTYQQAVDFCQPSMDALAAAREGSRNNTLNTAAKVVSHFVPGVWPEGAVEEWLYSKLDGPYPDSNDVKPPYPRDEAAKTIASAFKSAANDWKATLIPDTLATGNGTAVQQPARRRVELTAASTIKPKRVHWLWDGRMPLGELTLLAGREGIGKSTVCYQLASDVTRGMLPGEFKGQCRPVVVIATEDSWEHTIVPRLMAAGADTNMVFRAEVVTSDNIITGLSLPADTEMLKAQITEVGAAMVLLDPLISRLDTKLDTHKDAEVRQALEPLVQLAHDCRVSVLGLIHVNKSGSTDPLNSVMGSKAFTAVARSVLYCIVDPEDESEQRKLLGMPKNNLGRQDLPTLTFEIENTYVCESDDGPIYSGRITWGEELTRALRDVLETSQRGSEERTAVSEAAVWLEDYLKGCADGCMSKEAKKEGMKAGHSKSSIERAAKRLPITIKSEGFPRHTWWYWVPDEDRGESDLSDSASHDPFFLQ